MEEKRYVKVVDPGDNAHISKGDVLELVETEPPVNGVVTFLKVKTLKNGVQSYFARRFVHFLTGTPVVGVVNEVEPPKPPLPEWEPDKQTPFDPFKDFEVTSGQIPCDAAPQGPLQRDNFPDVAGQSRWVNPLYIN